MLEIIKNKNVRRLDCGNVLFYIVISIMNINFYKNDRSLKKKKIYIYIYIY